MESKKSYIKLILNIVLPVVAVGLCVFLLPKILKLFMPFFIGYLVSLIANPLVRFLDKRLKIVRKTGSAIVIVLVLVVVVLLIYGAVSGVAEQVHKMTQDMPTMAESAKEEYGNVKESLEHLYGRFPVEIRDRLILITENIDKYASDWISNISLDGFAGTAGSLVSNIPAILIGVIVGFLAAYFFIADKEKLDALIEERSSESMKRQYRAIRVQLFDVLGGYFKAQLKIMAVIYVILLIGLGILKTKYFFLTAFGIAFLDMLPFFGTGTVLGPWAIIKILTGEYKMAVALIVLYGVTQLVRQIIQPKLLGDSIGMNPFATLFFMYLGYLVAGVLGMILAVPFAMIIINLYKSGVFDVMVYSVKELYKDCKEFLHVDIPMRDKKNDAE